MEGDSATTAHAAAHNMLDTFGSVGATRFDVTLTTRAGTKVWFQRGMSLTDLRQTLPGMLDAAAKSERNVIVRPHGTDRTFIQLDDLKADQLALLAPAVFLALETSPGNFQAWVALAGIEDRDFIRAGFPASRLTSSESRVPRVRCRAGSPWLSRAE
jgi:hypothetical protein